MKNPSRRVSCAELFQFIPADLIDKLKQETKVDHQVKKLSGEVVLKLFLLTLLNSKKASLRIMQQTYESEKFQVFAGSAHCKIKHSGLANRITTINPVFFERIFKFLCKKFKTTKTKSKLKLLIYDSTLVGLSAKLLETGMNCGGKGDKKQIKFTVGFDGALPVSVKIFNKTRESSEDIALRQAIFDSKKTKDSIVVFDRGLQKRKTFCEFSQREILFVTRAKSKISYKLVRCFKNIKGRKSETLRFKEDLLVKLKDKDMKFTKETFRLIVAESLETKEELKFITNIRDLTAKEITDIYKRRWEIEVFFKFLKQELNFSHLISRNENGIKVTLYATLILAILLLVFKEKNKIASYKIAKLKFTQELDMEIVKEIVVMCGGDFSKYFSGARPYPR